MAKINTSIDLINRQSNRLNDEIAKLEVEKKNSDKVFL